MSEIQTPPPEANKPAHEALTVHTIMEKTVDAVRLSESNDRNMGSFVVDQIPDGSILPMANKVGMLADYENIPALERSTPEAFNAYKEQMAQDPTFQDFMRWQSSMKGEQAELAAALYFTTGLAKEYFGMKDISDEGKELRDKTYADYQVDPNRGDSLMIKPLSESGANAYCTEYSLFVKEGMRRLGHDLAYVVAERKSAYDDDYVYHSFLATQDGSTVIDPLITSQLYDKKMPYGIMDVETSLFEANEPLAAIQAGRPDAYPVMYSTVHAQAPTAVAA